jgi:hypothetical protein
MLRTSPARASLARCLAPLGALWICAATAPASAQPACQPTIAIAETAFSPMIRQKRFWNAKLDIDASRCVSASGNFSIGFLRLSETAPDLEFTQPLAWHAGRMDVVVEFAAEEAVGRYWISTIAPCACHSK